MAAPLVPTSPSRPTDTVAAKTPRRYELDWLRTCVVFGLIPFHTAIIFTTGLGDYVKNEQQTPVMNVLAGFITFWGIPLLFFVAGAASQFALRSRSPRQYVIERVMRLGIPFVFGVLVIVPIQVYIGTLASPGAHDAYPQFYIHYVRSWADVFQGRFPARGTDWVGHLWFIPPLILFSLVTLPLFRYLETPKGTRLIERIASHFTGWRMLVLFGVPLALGQLLLQSRLSNLLFLDFQVSANWVLLFIYLFFYVFGFIAYGDMRLLEAIRRDWPGALVLGSVAWLVFEVLFLTGRSPTNENLLGYTLVVFLRSYVSWLWVVALVGIAMRYLSGNSRMLSYLKDAAYPFYVLHMPVLTIVAFYVVQWDMPLLVKFLIIVGVSVPVTLLLYDVAVRRTPVTRFLFGLSTSHPSSQQAGSRHLSHGRHSDLPGHATPGNS
ncbi:MAG: acyltransferase family protein [Ktedonobacterales bacterium]